MPDSLGVSIDAQGKWSVGKKTQKGRDEFYAWAVDEDCCIAAANSFVNDGKSSTFYSIIASLFNQYILRD